MASNYTPKLYDQFGTKVSIDLGSLSELQSIRDGVNALGVQFAAFGPQLGSLQTTIVGQVGAQLSTVGDRVVQQVNGHTSVLGEHVDAVESTASSILIELQAERASAQQRHAEILGRLGQGTPGGTGTAAPLNEKSGPIVRLLNACQALVLAGSKQAALNETRDEVMRALEGAKDWQERLAGAMQRATSWSERSERYWVLQRLIEDVAQAGGGVSASSAQQPAQADTAAAV
ncbi:MAG: hypothetical protein AB1430_23460 [Pseudomonadota bacterium]